MDITMWPDTWQAGPDGEAMLGIDLVLVVSLVLVRFLIAIISLHGYSVFFFLNDPAPPEISTLPPPAPLPLSRARRFGAPFDVAFDEGVGVILFFGGFPEHPVCFQEGFREGYREFEGDPEVRGQTFGLHEVVHSSFYGHVAGFSGIHDDLVEADCFFCFREFAGADLALGGEEVFHAEGRLRRGGRRDQDRTCDQGEKRKPDLRPHAYLPIEQGSFSFIMTHRAVGSRDSTDLVDGRCGSPARARRAEQSAHSSPRCAAQPARRLLGTGLSLASQTAVEHDPCSHTAGRYRWRPRSRRSSSW